MSEPYRPGAISRMSLFGACALAVAMLCVPNAGIAAQSVGVTQRVQNEVIGSSGKRKLSRQDPVYRSESISAGANSFGEIELSDGARVLVGENSKVSLDDFVISSSSFRRAGITVTKGAFRYISGSSRKGAFKFKTPLSSIGVRGTVFDVYVRERGVTDLVLLRGQVNVCGRGGGCILVDEPCDIVSVGTNGRVSREPFLRSTERSRLEEIRRFPLTSVQWRYSPRFYAPVARCNARAQLFPNRPQRDSGREPGSDH